MLSLLAALLLDQYRPERHVGLQKLLHPLQMLAWQLNAGRHEHGRLAWFAAVIPAFLGIWMTSLFLHHLGYLPGWLWQTGILYLSLTFKRHTTAARKIASALASQQTARAASLWLAWQNTPPPSAEDLPRLTIIALFTASMRETFGVIVWLFVLFPFSPAGALLYRMTQAIAEHWLPDTHGEFSRFAHGVLRWLDWLPARALALGFAVAGNFENAIYGWRSQPMHEDNNLGILLASASGALDLRLLPDSLREENDEAEPASWRDIASAISLLWRTLAIWLLLIGLASFGS